MLVYLLKRLFFFIPTLIAISLLAFGLSELTPGNRVADQLQQGEDSSSGMGREMYLREFKAVAKSLGEDKPGFYFTLTSAAYPDTLYRVLLPNENLSLSRLTDQCGNWEAAASYFYGLQAFEQELKQLPDSLGKNTLIRLKRINNLLYSQSKESKIRPLFRQLRDTAAAAPAIARQIDTPLNQLEGKMERMYTEATLYNRYIPRLHWYGLDNQYHNWLINFIRGDFGKAIDGRWVADKIGDAMWWTVIINTLAILLVFLIAVPLGIFSAIRRNSFFDKSSTLGLFLLYSMPSFWVSTMLVIFFTTPEYGCKIFASIGLGDLPSSAPFMDRFMEKASHLILPIICTAYTGLAFVSRQMRGSMLEVIQQDYIRTARAKGLAEKKVVWKHAFKNALFPIITLFASIFPAAVGGSLVVEIIFNIPGMGRLLLTSIFAADWPVVFTVLMLVAFLTVIGNFVADILYSLADPRVRFAR